MDRDYFDDHPNISTPDIRFESEIEFCQPSWKRSKKYVSFHHWFSTKTPYKRTKNVDRPLRYKLFEMGHYAGATILQVGLEDCKNLSVPISAGLKAGHKVQYFAIDNVESRIQTASKIVKEKRFDSTAIFFNGSLSEFRNEFLITPTMVIVNQRHQTEAIIKHLALFLEPGTPVLIKNWFTSRSDNREVPSDDSFDCFGRFGESLLLRSKCEYLGEKKTLSEFEFQRIRKLEPITSRKSILQNNSIQTVLKNSKSTAACSNTQWPYAVEYVEYPDTLPDGSPWPKISVVTPTYNQGKFIEQTINSVLNQQYPNLEYIIVDGGSTDETPEILDKYKEQFDHLISEPDEGQSDAINKGMNLTTGEILTWLNSDDLFTPGTLYAMAMGFWKSKADMVVGTVQLLQGDKIVSEHLTSCDNGPLRLPELLDLENNWLKGRFFYQPELMFTRDLWERSGGYVDTELYYSMDHELWLRFAVAEAKLHVIGRPTVIYRVHDEQKTHDDYQPELREVNRRYREKYPDAIEPTTQLPRKKYRATFVNDVGSRYGAGIAHSRLRESLDAAGHETTFVSAKPTEKAKPKKEFELYQEIENSEPDVVFFGNLHNANLDCNLVDHVSHRWPSCFVMHDLWLTTGRCCYLGSCDKFKSGCDADCPTASQYPALPTEKIQDTFENKLRIVSQNRKLVALANSEWTKSIAEQSAITKKCDVETIKYGFPTSQVFKPRNKKLCREILGLPKDAFIVLFASVNVHDERKGVLHLFEALNQLDLPNMVPVCIGRAFDDANVYPGSISLGYIGDPWQQAIIYAAADVFVGPSLQEAFGQVFIEAAACGTPALAYRVGGVEDAIVPGVTGLLVKEIRPNCLAQEIYHLYSEPEYRKNLGVWGRIEIENEWSYRSAYHRMNCTLSKFGELFGFLPPANINFNPQKTHGVSNSTERTFGILSKGKNAIRKESGFAPPETIELKDGEQSSAQWATGRTCELAVHIAKPGSFVLRAKCLNPNQEQCIEVYLNDELHHSFQVPSASEFKVPVQFDLAGNLQSGDHQIRLKFSKTLTEKNKSRELAMLFLDLSFNEQNQTYVNRAAS